MSNDLAVRMRTILFEHLGVEGDRLVDSASFYDDLGADSLDLVEILMAAEEEFDILITDDEAESVKTVGDAISIVRKLAA